MIFGATDGIMDVALQSIYYLVTGKTPDPNVFVEIWGNESWREVSATIPGAGAVRAAAASGLANAQRLMEALAAVRRTTSFVEAMACPSRCAGGGGQPIHEVAEMTVS